MIVKQETGWRRRTCALAGWNCYGLIRINVVKQGDMIFSAVFPTYAKKGNKKKYTMQVS